MKGICCIFLFVARICLGAVFLLSGVNKLFHYDATAQYMAAHGMTMVPFFLIGAIVIEIFGSLTLIIGYRPKLSALLLALYLIPVTYIFHSFWNMPVEQQQEQMIHFLKNLAIFGGLLGLAFNRTIPTAPCCTNDPKPYDTK